MARYIRIPGVFILISPRPGWSPVHVMVKAVTIKMSPGFRFHEKVLNMQSHFIIDWAGLLWPCFHDAG